MELRGVSPRMLGNARRAEWGAAMVCGLVRFVLGFLGRNILRGGSCRIFIVGLVTLYFKRGGTGIRSHSFTRRVVDRMYMATFDSVMFSDGWTPFVPSDLGER